MPSKSPNDWLKKIFSVGSLSLIIAIIGTIIAYKSLMADAGGTLSAISTPEAQSIAEHPRTVIAYNDQSVPVLNDYLPELKNTSENTLRDFVLYFTFRGDGFSVEPTGFYDLKTTPHSQTLTHSDERLGAGLSAQPPLQALTIDGDGRADIDVRVTASFSGASEPLHIDRRMRLLYLPRSATDTPGSWYLRVAAMTPNATVQAYWSESDSRRLGSDDAVRVVEDTPARQTITTTTTTTTHTQPTTSPTQDEKVVAIAVVDDESNAESTAIKTDASLHKEKDEHSGWVAVGLVFLMIAIFGAIGYAGVMGILLTVFLISHLSKGRDISSLRWYWNKEFGDWTENPKVDKYMDPFMWYYSWSGIVIILVLLIYWIFF